MFIVKRSKFNPIIKPNPKNEWESQATYNGCPIKVGKKINLLYRALSKAKKFESTSFSLSTIGIAEENSSGLWKTKGQLIIPIESWEKYGCEDPRVTYIDGNYYIFYTALGLFPFRGNGIKVAVAISKDLETIKERHLVTPFNAKAMSLFPEKIDGKYNVIFAANTDDGHLAKISIAKFSKIEDIWDKEKWEIWYKEIDKYTLKIPKKENEQIEVGAPPIKTPFGWLLIYSHIKNYFTENDKVFGIGAVLLDLKDTQKVIAQTPNPFMFPEEKYEKEGIVKNIVFPSGAIIDNGILKIFYGGADTICAYAEMPVMAVLASMNFFVKDEKGDIQKVDNRKMPLKVASYKKEYSFQRIVKKPILIPNSKNKWESKAVFNPAAIEINNTVHLLYRAMSEDNTSSFGYAKLENMIDIKNRGIYPVYTPRLPFEEKRIPNGNSGCEDPRLTLIDKKIYMTYTAYDGVNPWKIALTSISIKDFLSGIWRWSVPVIVSHDGVDDKDGVLFSEKIKNKYALIHRVNSSIYLDYSDTLEFKNRNQFKNNMILGPRKGMWDSIRVGAAMTPIISEYGWILIYHGIDENTVYRIGVALLDLSNPEKVLARTVYPLFEPETDYEIKGQVNNVVFPCGAAVKKDSLYIYYGGADTVIGVASIKLKNLLKTLGVV